MSTTNRLVKLAAAAAFAASGVTFAVAQQPSMKEQQTAPSNSQNQEPTKSQPPSDQTPPAATGSGSAPMGPPAAGAPENKEFPPNTQKNLTPDAKKREKSPL